MIRHDWVQKPATVRVHGHDLNMAALNHAFQTNQVLDAKVYLRSMSYSVDSLGFFSVVLECTLQDIDLPAELPEHPGMIF